MSTVDSYRNDRDQRVLFGTGALAALPAAIADLAVTRLLIVTSPSLVRCGVLDRLRRALPDSMETAVYDTSREHTPLKTIEEAYKLARENDAQAVLGLGGGSAMDTAKGVILALLAGSLDFGEFVGTREGMAEVATQRYSANGRPALLIQVPTTLSAAEATRQAGLTSAEGIKEQYFHPAVEAAVIVLDPEMTVHTPERLWLSTGIKALDHAVELSYSRQTNDFAQGLAYQSARLLRTYLPLSRREPDNLEHRARLQTAAWMTGHGAMRTDAGMGLDHALGHRLGGYLGISHGIAACITLPHSMRLNLSGAREQLTALARWSFGAADAEDAVRGVDELIGELGLPRRLRDFVPNREKLRPLPELVLTDTAMDGNPRQDITAADIADLLDAAW